MCVECEETEGILREDIADKVSGLVCWPGSEWAPTDLYLVAEHPSAVSSYNESELLCVAPNYGTGDGTWFLNVAHKS